MLLAKRKFWLCQNCETLNEIISLSCEVCGEKIPVEYCHPIIKQFEVSSRIVNDCESINISWATENAQYVLLNGVRVSANGNKDVAAVDRVVLVAHNKYWKIQKTKRIKVIKTPEIINFTFPSKVTYGDSAEILWNARNLKKVIFEDKEFNPNEIISIQPNENRDYEIVFEGLDGPRVQRRFRIEVVFPPPFITIKTPQFGIIGKTVRVEWTTENVQSVYIDENEYPANSFVEWIYGNDRCGREIRFRCNDGTEETHLVYIKEKPINLVVVSLVVLLYISFILFSVILFVG